MVDSISSDVINAMAEFNFRVTPYPVVLSIENHCSLDQQELLAEIMRVGFGDSLLMPGELMGSGTNLPTLDQLKYKVLIKGKRLKVGEGIYDDADDESGDDDSGDDDNDDDDDTPAAKSGKSSSKKKSPALKVHPSLSAIVFLGTCHCTSFAKGASDAIPPDMMTSYGESKTIKYIKNESIRQGWIYHNRTHLRLVIILSGYAHSLLRLRVLIFCCHVCADVLP
jgi:phosphatidylinositol phospholipase C delta